MADYKERGNLIIQKLEDSSINGDTYIDKRSLFLKCYGAESRRNLEEFQLILDYLIRQNRIFLNGNKCYLIKNWRLENSVAEKLRDYTINNEYRISKKTYKRISSSLNICDEQIEAINMALTHRLSIVLGGAGSGKTTLIKELVDCSQVCSFALCAPTGKAARNLMVKTGYFASTIHKAFRPIVNSSMTDFNITSGVDLIVVDEASMLSLDLFSRILFNAKKDSRIVLVGDPNQLPAVGAGNVINDLITLGMPSYKLSKNHRQNPDAKALLSNVGLFNEIRCASNLEFDKSFELYALEDWQILNETSNLAAREYLQGRDVQVLAPFNEKTNLSVYSLNQEIRDKVNPYDKSKEEILIKNKLFRSGDRVIMKKNNYKKMYFNGDIGSITIMNVNGERFVSVEFKEGGTVKWYPWEIVDDMDLAYAFTIHKAQGSEFATVIISISKVYSIMLNRSLLYTAISRARQKIVFIGNREAIQECLEKNVKRRNTSLVEKVFAASGQPNTVADFLWNGSGIKNGVRKFPIMG